MNFTPKIKLGLAAGVVVLAMGLATGRTVGPDVASDHTSRVQELFQARAAVATVEAVEIAPASDLQTPQSADCIQTSSWYKNKHWWKKNAPIVGGAGGGALIGGLAGGGKGAIIGGAVGGGGGYLYKRLRHHNDQHHQPNNTTNISVLTE